MPERDNEMNLREALLGAVAADQTAEGAPADDLGGEAMGGDTPVAAEAQTMPEATPAAVSPENTHAEAAAVPAAGDPLANTGSMPAAVPANGVPSQAEMWKAMSQLIAENTRLNQAMQQRELQFNQLNAQQNAAMQEQSKAAETAIMGQFTPEAAIPKSSPASTTAAPVLNFSEISYLPPEEQQARLSQWQQESMNYAIRTATAQIRDEITREIAPVKEDYEAKRRIAENDAARTTLLNMPQFADMKGKEGDLDKIIAVNPLLQGAKPDQRYLLAALISRGMNASHQMTTEELIEKASANPDVMKALEARRVSEIQQNNAALPKVVPSSGMGNANAVPEEKPTNVDGIRNLLYNRLGLKR